MSQTPEKRIYLQYQAMRRRRWSDFRGISQYRLRLARQWKRSCQEIKAIVARKGEPEVR
jgi:hypothetical protein